MNDEREMYRLGEVCFPSSTRGVGEVTVDGNVMTPCLLCWAMVPLYHPLDWSAPSSPIYGLTKTQAMHVGFHVIMNEGLNTT